MSANEITYRGDYPAINVKDDCLYARDPRFDEFVEKLGQARIDSIYEGIQEAFWRFYAPELAKQYGYGEISSDGRSGGWLLVEGTPPFDPDDIGHTLVSTPVIAALANRRQWEKFERAIDALINGCRDMFWEELHYAVNADANETSEAYEMACRDIVTVS